MIITFQPCAGGVAAFRDDREYVIADISQDLKTGRYAIWAEGEYLGSSSDIDGAQERVQRWAEEQEINPRDEESEDQMPKKPDTSKLPPDPLAKDAPPTPAAQQARRPRKDKGVKRGPKKRAERARAAGPAGFQKLLRIYEIDQDIAALHAERGELIEGLGGAEWDTIQMLSAVLSRRGEQSSEKSTAAGPESNTR